MTVKDLFDLNRFELDNGTDVTIDGCEGGSVYYFGSSERIMKAPKTCIMLTSPLNESELAELKVLRDEWQRLTKIQINMSWACSPDRMGR